MHVCGVPQQKSGIPCAAVHRSAFRALFSGSGSHKKLGYEVKNRVQKKWCVAAEEQYLDSNKDLGIFINSPTKKLQKKRGVEAGEQHPGSNKDFGIAETLQGKKRCEIRLRAVPGLEQGPQDSRYDELPKKVPCADITPYCFPSVVWKLMDPQEIERVVGQKATGFDSNRAVPSFEQGLRGNSLARARRGASCAALHHTAFPAFFQGLGSHKKLNGVVVIKVLHHAAFLRLFGGSYKPTEIKWPSEEKDSTHQKSFGRKEQYLDSNKDFRVTALGRNPCTVPRVQHYTILLFFTCWKLINLQEIESSCEVEKRVDEEVIKSSTLHYTTLLSLHIPQLINVCKRLSSLAKVKKECASTEQYLDSNKDLGVILGPKSV
ncbi:hypothetical protein B0H16DRAFT_1470071 [Mycena metata]|uniref:Uncharacterized protein n=1 Tax=Mycena metata TaxID=1033252 RepID=A0AAD7HVN8_9AGAR|nr:hypothetical protein B0H16DRAFT_1470071 [Mycena metata]